MASNGDQPDATSIMSLSCGSSHSACLAGESWNARLGVACLCHLAGPPDLEPFSLARRMWNSSDLGPRGGRAARARGCRPAQHADRGACAPGQGDQQHRVRRRVHHRLQRLPATSVQLGVVSGARLLVWRAGAARVGPRGPAGLRSAVGGSASPPSLHGPSCLPAALSTHFAVRMIRCAGGTLGGWVMVTATTCSCPRRWPFSVAWPSVRCAGGREQTCRARGRSGDGS